MGDLRLQRAGFRAAYRASFAVGTAVALLGVLVAQALRRRVAREGSAMNGSQPTAPGGTLGVP